MSETEKLIETTFISMLEKEKLSRITVKDITSKCGISRNSFYYHYEDIPALLDRITMRAIDDLISGIPKEASLRQCIRAIYSYAYSRKNVILHVRFSSGSFISDGYLLHLCRYTSRRYLESHVFSDARSNLTEHDKHLLLSFMSYELAGQFTDWMNQRMPESFINDISDICNLLENYIRAVAN